jgi:hypothetical protein
MQLSWVDGNLTIKPDDPYDLGLLIRIEEAYKAWKDRDRIKVSGNWTWKDGEAPDDAFRIAL